jgi:Cu-Zn family superoxide dismutase
MQRAFPLATAAVLLFAPGAVLSQPAPAPTTVPTRTATAIVQGLGSNLVKGIVLFTAVPGGVEIDAEITGLAPGRHGFHIHEFGDCSGRAPASAGPHFNPDRKPHGAPGTPRSHAGDLGNLTADASGRALLKLVSHAITLDQGPTGIVGRSVVVHEKPDDLKSQPAGNAGGGIGCGVILLDSANTILVRKQ